MRLIELSKEPDSIIFRRTFAGQETSKIWDWKLTEIPIEAVMADLTLLQPYLDIFDKACKDTEEYDSECVISKEYNLYDHLVDDRPNDPIGDYQFRMACTGYKVYINYQGTSYILNRN